jgi:hypothetical protein
MMVRVAFLPHSDTTEQENKGGVFNRCLSPRTYVQETSSPQSMEIPNLLDNKLIQSYDRELNLQHSEYLA